MDDHLNNLITLHGNAAFNAASEVGSARERLRIARESVQDSLQNKKEFKEFEKAFKAIVPWPEQNIRTFLRKEGARRQSVFIAALYSAADCARALDRAERALQESRDHYLRLLAEFGEAE